MTKRDYIIHLVECNCILPQFKKMEEPIFHKFPVFSVIDENNKIIEKMIRCPNCSLAHRVFDTFKSEIISSGDENIPELSIKDLKSNIPKELSFILEDNQVIDLYIWEQAEFILDEELWGTQLKLNSKTSGEKKHLKILEIQDKNKFKVKVIICDNFIQ